MESKSNDILHQYHAISNKLKKRFLRKPNLTEACESFGALAKQCEHSELPAYAGMCWISAARCEGSLGNIPGEASCLIKAARQFLTSEETDQNFGYVSPSQENLQAAVGCYAYAASRFPAGCSIPVGLNLELVNFLNRADRSNHVELHLKNAIEQAGDNLETKIYCFDLLASHYIKTHDFSGALNCYKEIETILNRLPLNGARAEFFRKCEVCQLLLLLILRPEPQKQSPSLTKLLEKYTASDVDDKGTKILGMSDHLMILLQSLVASCQSQDKTDLDYLKTELWKLMGSDEQELLRVVIQTYSQE